MRIRLGLLLSCLVVALASVATAQEWAPDSERPSAAPAGPPPPAVEQMPEGEWVPHGVAVLGQDASSRVEFRLDHSMLALASKIDSGNPEFQRAMAELNGISFRTFRFP